MLEGNSLRVIAVIALAILSSTLSAFVYYNKIELREIGVHFVVIGVAFFLQMLISGSIKLRKRDELMVASRGFGAIFIWISVLVFIIFSMFLD